MNRARSGPAARRGDAGLTLVEVLVALLLLALIGAAGFSVLDQVIRVQSLTEGRLDRLAQIQRAMHLVTLDLMQATGGSVEAATGALTFRRAGPAGELAVRYGLEDATLVRRLSGGEGVARQALLSGVRDLRWSFRDDDGWTDAWPPESARDRANPSAVALDLDLDGPALAGGLRRVAVLPAEPGR